MPLITPRAAVLKLLHANKLEEPEKLVINQILRSSPEIEKAVELGREFENLLMGRSTTSLDDWLGKAQNEFDYGNKIICPRFDAGSISCTGSHKI